MDVSTRSTVAITFNRHNNFSFLLEIPNESVVLAFEVSRDRLLPLFIPLRTEVKGVGAGRLRLRPGTQLLDIILQLCKNWRSSNLARAGSCDEDLEECLQLRVEARERQQGKGCNQNVDQ